MILISHRGAHKKFPENTFAAFEEAYKHGLRVFETDVRLTKDKKAVLFHDPDLKRICNIQKNVRDLTLGEFERLDCKGCKLYSLEHFFQDFKGKVKFDLELKEADSVEEVVKLIQKYRLENDVVISSYASAVPRKVRKLAPSISLGQLGLSGHGAIFKARRTHTDIVIIPSMGLRWDHVLHAHISHIDVWAWPVNSKEHFEKMKRIGVDGIITDYPEALK